MDGNVKRNIFMKAQNPFNANNNNNNDKSKNDTTNNNNFKNNNQSKIIISTANYRKDNNLIKNLNILNQYKNYNKTRDISN